MINHKALAKLRQLANYIEYYRFLRPMRGMAEMAYYEYLMNNTLGIDTDNVDMIDQEPVKE